MEKIKSAKLILFAILTVSVFLHVFNITKPSEPVFDEKHFVTYAVNYRQNRPILDIHPPLGKILYALPLFFLDSTPVNDFKFINLKKDNLTGNLIFNVFPKDYGKFPFIPLRLVSGLFGVALLLAVYLFIKNFSGSESAALLGALFITFENALLLETRLILLNGMYLTFGFLALAFLFKEKSQPFLAGLIWGLALSVKLVAVVFLGPVIIYSLMKKSSAFAEFLISGSIVFLIIILFMNSLFIAPAERLALYNSLGLPLAEKIWSDTAFGQNLQAAVAELNISLSGYTTGVNPHPDQSKWYQWFLMIKPVNYAESEDKMLALVGNPVVWFLSLAAILWSIFKFKKNYLVLVGGYFFSLLPFIFVDRPAFLYHYFPALIFGISLAAILISEKLDHLSSLEKKRWLIGLSSVVILFFIIISPLTLGL